MDQLGDVDETWDEDLNKWVFKPQIPGYPFYVFKQPYSSGQLIEKVYTPQCPLDVKQLPPAAVANAIRFPFSFDCVDTFQIAHYCLATAGRCIKEREEGINVIEYFNLPDNDGKEALFRGSITGDRSCKLCGKCHLPGYNGWGGLYSMQYGFYPTIIVLFSPLDIDGRDWDLYKLRYTDVELAQKMLTMPVLGGIPLPKKDHYYSREDIVIHARKYNLTPFMHNCKPFLTADILKISPYCIVATEAALDLLKEVYEVRDGKIRISEEFLPLFHFEHLESQLDEIRTLAMQPYRGIQVPYVEPYTEELPHEQP